MKSCVSVWVIIFVGSVSLNLVSAQAPSAKAIDRLDPALDQIVSANAKLEILKEDYFGNAEGPVWLKQGSSGYLLFTDIGANTIYKWTPDGKITVFLEHTGYNSE